METIYLIIVILLFVLAASDLIVGVSNDAVNFLNSAVGSKASSFKIIMVIAALGILVGALFSSGMMEVARKGIFNPGEFYFGEIMIIFMAVMVTDVLLLDAYNTIGLPTSTTVSIVFELLGAAVAMAAIKVIMSETDLTVGQFINSSKALAIISGILLSVFIAFTVGAIIQYFVRIAFSFNFKKRIKYIGGLWGGIAFTALTYFMLIKGAKGASFMSADIKDWISANSILILFYSFIGWTLILQFLFWIFRINILKIIVLVGTFSLAMAFAGNDLVNFIGVPIAGFNSWEFFRDSGSGDPFGMLMGALGGKVPTPGLFLVGAGIIMVITLYTSRKAKSVLKTSIDLSRQEEGDERFRPTWISKVLVKSTLKFSSNLNKAVPVKVKSLINKQFEKPSEVVTDPDPPAFDLIRASVNLTVASILIAFGTSLKLPLSTTYVTFMVAMGTSLADNAWGRESAVYRISGVMTVIGGWFLTALSAFIVAFLIVFVFYFGEIYAMFGIMIIVGYVIYRSHKFHNKAATDNQEESLEVKDIDESNIHTKSVNTIAKNLEVINNSIEECFVAIKKEDYKPLKKINKKIKGITTKTKYMKDHINLIVERLRESSIDTSYYFVQVLDFMREALHSVTHIIEPAQQHIENNHKPLIEVQIKELFDINNLYREMSGIIIQNITSGDYGSQDKIQDLLDKLTEMIEASNKKQIKRIKAQEVGTKNSILFLNILNEMKQLAFNTINIYKSQRDFNTNS